ncbi:MAG: MoaD/ThiS family protein [Candidatus Omnitrophica bacterium]|nr:MoaD/ThiS family protein [Candidatus Omnitrophota bacterium]MDE2223305.1 MoaD/ThiS family protein [Candidatus Omnitrophota bacterium]
MIRLILPFHLRNLARVQGEVALDAARPVTLASVLDALEAKYPMLTGTIRDRDSRKRRPLVRFFACEEDISNQAMDKPLPEAVAAGLSPLLVVGSVAGG